MKFEVKKKSICYIGQVFSEEDTKVEIDFFRINKNSTFKPPYIHCVAKSQIVQVLSNPTYMGSTPKIYVSTKFECNFDVGLEMR